MPPVPTLLIADDETDIREALKALFAAEPYRLAFADNGEEALALAAEVFPDVVLLDVMMPGLDGLEVRRLRADPRLGGVPSVLITALADQATRLAGLGVLALSVVDNSTWVGKRRCEEMKRQPPPIFGQRARASERNESQLKECGCLPNISDN